MSKFHVNKMETAKRQMHTAIDLFFGNGDSISIHTLAAASGTILRDLCKKNRESTIYYKNLMSAVESVYAEDRTPLNEFWSAYNKAANYFKHAERDSDIILTNVNESMNEGTLIWNCLFYKDLGHELTKKMQFLMGWAIACSPGSAEYFNNSESKAIFTDVNSSLYNIHLLEREDRISIGRKLYKDVLFN
ncbi:MAG: hypothetical protein COB76_02760 [Alphaproteobacteria bacterium]|nr:MAG: hypothetical protein COB76_02760 [Alphaproteobacteria bacterium]